MSLKNEDFRKLLSTPRPGARPNLGAQADAADKKHKKPRPPRPNRPKPREDGAPGEREAGDEDGGGYRDRAAERRKGVGAADLEGVPATLGVLGGAHPSDLSHLTYEESKFLGGDVEHTHLVKGLDYALLNKIKSEQAAAQRGGGGDAEGGGEGREGAAPGGAAALRQVTFKSPLGRAVHDFFFGPQRRATRTSVAEQFLPRRTAFVFDLEDPCAPDVPTTLRRAKEDCPLPKERILAGLDGAVLERMAKIMAYMTLSDGGRKKLKKKERRELLQQHGLSVQGALKQPEQPSAEEGPGAGAGAGAAAVPAEERKPVDEGEDIFGDAGTEYVAERRGEDAEAAARPALPLVPGAHGAYFADGGAALEEGLPPLLGAVPRGAGGHPEADAYPDTDAAYPDTDAAYAAAEAEAARQAQQEREREEKRKRLLAEDADDGYAECYPAYHDVAGTAYDSEDEDGKGAPLDGKGAAAPAPGEGADGGGPARKEAIKARMKETAKLSSELTKIKEIFSEKGYEHGTAFDKAARPERDGTRSGGKPAAEGGGPVLPAKRRRI